MLRLCHVCVDVREVAQLDGTLHDCQAHVDDLLRCGAVVPGPHIALESALQQCSAASPGGAGGMLVMTPVFDGRCWLLVQ